MAIIHIVRIVAASTKNKWSFHFWRRVLEHRNATANLNNFPIYLITVFDVMCCCTTPEEYRFENWSTVCIIFFIRFFREFFSKVFFSAKNLIISHKKIGSLKKCKNFEFSVICIFCWEQFSFSSRRTCRGIFRQKKNEWKKSTEIVTKIQQRQKTYTQTHCVEYAALSTQWMQRPSWRVCGGKSSNLTHKESASRKNNSQKIKTHVFLALLDSCFFFRVFIFHCCDGMKFTVISFYEFVRAKENDMHNSH